jgi:hypothetical protein
MHMFWLYIQLQNFYLFHLLAQLIDLLFDTFAKLAFQYSIMISFLGLHIFQIDSSYPFSTTTYGRAFSPDSLP